jgi:hypothetical protein
LEGQFATHHRFADVTVEELLGSHFKASAQKEAVVLESSVFLNRGDHFERFALPSVVQRSPVMGLAVADFDGDGVEDVFLAQNFHGESLALTRGDSGQGVLLRGNGRGQFEAMEGTHSGIRMEGEQRGVAVSDLNRDGRVDLAVGQNNGATRLFLNQTGRAGLRVRLTGDAGNPNGIGSLMRVELEGGMMGPGRWVGSGGGLGSQDSFVPVLGLRGKPKALWIRWPGGKEERRTIGGNPLEFELRKQP